MITGLRISVNDLGRSPEALAEMQRLALASVVSNSLVSPRRRRGCTTVLQALYRRAATAAPDGSGACVVAGGERSLRE